MGETVRASVEDGIGWLTLDRPGALNALDRSMIDGLSAALAAWRADPAVRAVVLDSAAPKAFCAGADIVAVRRAAVRGDRREVRGYFAAEYALDALIAGYPKPFVSLVDGHALGGGLGLAALGRYLVAGDRALLGMPETAIGFFPDVGAGYFLPRLRGATGRYLGLTGARLTGPEAVRRGLATHHVDSADLPALRRALAAERGHQVPAVLARFARPAGAADPEGRWAAVDRCFTPGGPEGAGTAGDAGDAGDAGGAADPEYVDRVLRRLAAEPGEWAAETLAGLRAASPSSLVLTAEVLRRGAADTLAGCLDRDLRLAVAVTATHDFAEGVRAMLVDKDRRPVWDPPAVEDLTARHRAALLALLGD